MKEILRLSGTAAALCIFGVPGYSDPGQRTETAAAGVAIAGALTVSIEVEPLIDGACREELVDSTRTIVEKQLSRLSPAVVRIERSSSARCNCEALTLEVIPEPTLSVACSCGESKLGGDWPLERRHWTLRSRSCSDDVSEVEPELASLVANFINEVLLRPDVSPNNDLIVEGCAPVNSPQWRFRLRCREDCRFFQSRLVDYILEDTRGGVALARFQAREALPSFEMPAAPIVLVYKDKVDRTRNLTAVCANAQGLRLRFALRSNRLPNTMAGVRLDLGG